MGKIWYQISCEDMEFICLSENAHRIFVANLVWSILGLCAMHAKLWGGKDMKIMQCFIQGLLRKSRELCTVTHHNNY